MIMMMAMIIMMIIFIVVVIINHSMFNAYSSYLNYTNIYKNDFILRDNTIIYIIYIINCNIFNVIICSIFIKIINFIY